MCPRNKAHDGIILSKWPALPRKGHLSVFAVRRLHYTRGVISGAHMPRHTWVFLLHCICSASPPSSCVPLLLWIAVRFISVSLSSLLIRFSSSVAVSVTVIDNSLGFTFQTSPVTSGANQQSSWLLTLWAPSWGLDSPLLSSALTLFSPFFQFTLQIWTFFLKLPCCIGSLKRISSSLTTDLVLRFSWPLRNSL